jgi:hypothetical protein
MHANACIHHIAFHYIPLQTLHAHIYIYMHKHIATNFNLEQKKEKMKTNPPSEHVNINNFAKNLDHKTIDFWIVTLRASSKNIAKWRHVF